MLTSFEKIKHRITHMCISSFGKDAISEDESEGVSE